jgi:hypothetical protein
MANYLTQQDVDNYGSDLLDVSQRAALNAVAPYLQQTEGRMQQLEQQNADLRARQARDRRRVLDQQVEQAIPDYRDFDRDPGWHKWLIGIDLMSGRVRQQLLNEAVQNGNVARVKSFFDGYRQEAGSPQTQTASGRRAGRADKPIYTRADIQKAHRAYMQGGYRGREAEYERLQAEFVRASAEGRVVGGTDIWGK